MEGSIQRRRRAPVAITGQLLSVSNSESRESRNLLLEYPWYDVSFRLSEDILLIKHPWQDHTLLTKTHRKIEAKPAKVTSR